MKQAICNCGRIAEVKRRKNGQHLRFLNCTECGTQLASIKMAATIEATEADDIGVKGEFFEVAPVPQVVEKAIAQVETVTAVHPADRREPKPEPKPEPEPEPLPGQVAAGPHNDKDFQPVAEDMPAALESQSTTRPPEADSETESEAGSSDGLWWKVLLGVVATGLIGGGVYVGVKGGQQQ